MDSCPLCTRERFLGRGVCRGPDRGVHTVWQCDSRRNVECVDVEVLGWHSGYNRLSLWSESELREKDMWLLTSTLVGAVREIGEGQAKLSGPFGSSAISGGLSMSMLCPGCLKAGCGDEVWLPWADLKDLSSRHRRGTFKCRHPSGHSIAAVDIRNRWLECDGGVPFSPHHDCGAVVVGVEWYTAQSRLVGATKVACSHYYSLDHLGFWLPPPQLNVTRTDFLASVESAVRGYAKARSESGHPSSMFVFSFVGHGFTDGGDLFLMPSDGHEGE